MSRNNLAWLLGIFGVSLLGFVVSIHATAREQDRDYEHIRLFVDVLHEVRSRYVYKISPERERKLVEDMLNGGLERLNPHNAFIGQREYKQFTKRSEGKFGGIGIHIGYDPDGKGRLTVISPMVGTPAHEAGVLAGDVILKINDESTDNMRINEAIDLIAGEPDKEIALTVKHEDGETERLTMARAEIKIPSVLGDRRKDDDVKKWEFLIDKTNGIGYIRLVEFTRTTAEELRDALKQLKKDGMRGLVIDLRGNPGGLLSSAKEVSNLFLSEGRIVSTKGRDGDEQTFDADPREALLGPESGIPMAILINRYSASASEIVSAALQDHKRAVIVGERSYGKGSVQNVIPMEKGTSALKLTTASYWRPSGKNIDKHPDSKEDDEWGVTPDKGLVVELTAEQRAEYVRWRNDRDIVRAKKKPKKESENDTKKPEKDAKKPEKDPKKPYVDPVLQKATDHLKQQIKKAEREQPLHDRARA